MRRVILFTGTEGLNMEVDPVRHEYSEKDGIRDLAIAKNVDFDYTGRIRMRRGWKYTAITGNCHSLFSDGGDAVFVTGDALTILGSGYSTTALRNVTVGARMSYAQVGSKIYYANGREIGYITGGKSIAWQKPATVYHSKDSTRVLSGPPIGSLLEYFNGRMYVIQSSVAWVSEQYNVNVYALSEDYIPFESTVTMFKGVTDGIWVGTRNRIVFLRGTNPEDFRYEVKGLFGAIPGTVAKIDSFKVGNGNIPEVGVIFATKYGPCLGTSDGRLVPLTEKKVSVPSVVRGAGAVLDKKYLFNVDDYDLTVVMNLRTAAISQYSNYNFNSFCEFNGKYLGANESGIFELDAQDRDISSVSSTTAITSKFVIGPTDLGIKTDKRLRKCVVALAALGAVKMTVQADDGSDGQVEVSVISGTKNKEEHAISLPFGRDMRGRYFTFTFENVNGAYFCINNIEAFIEILLRKTSKEGVI